MARMPGAEKVDGTAKDATDAASGTWRTRLLALVNYGWRTPSSTIDLSKGVVVVIRSVSTRTRRDEGSQSRDIKMDVFRGLEKAARSRNTEYLVHATRKPYLPR
jgi:hypothetical protein